MTGLTQVPTFCEQSCETGPCRGYFPRYCWDAQHERCTRFIYGGCGGNSNNFKTLRQCHRRCQPGGDSYIYL